ncbi:MAG: HPF/RaiA family ribosome-associated protein [Vicinamibacterales bacterium]
MPTKAGVPAAKPSTATRGRTDARDIPIDVRSPIRLAPAFLAQIRTKLVTHLDHAAPLIERATVRFEDVNGPKGGNGDMCRIELVLSGRPSVRVEHRSDSYETAFARVLPKLAQRLARVRDKHNLSVGRQRSVTVRPPRVVAPEDTGEIIGKRAGHGAKALARALERPEKQRRDAYVDTSLPGVSASDRKAGGGHSARRNTKARHAKATVALEDSTGRPSRKSTRRGANHGKPSQGKERTALAKAMAPSARTRHR